MSKQNSLTKVVAKMIKAKGLQKLRFYCQVCRKQCRDANGYKCHVNSESHLRMMKVFSENPTTFIEQYSKEFEKTFLDLLRARWRFKRVKANKVYNEHIQDRHHVHMNATKWKTLTQFCYYLQETGKVTVDESPEGIYITYIDNDPATLAKREAKEKAEKMIKDDEKKLDRKLKTQMILAQLMTSDEPEENEETVTNDNNSTDKKDEEDKKEESKITMTIKPSKPQIKISAFAETKKKKKRKRSVETDKNQLDGKKSKVEEQTVA